MKKLILILFPAIIAISCSKKVEVKGKIAGASPMERIEFINASDVATLPITNTAVSQSGDFSATFDVPHDGIYVMTFAGKIAPIFIEKGQSVNVSANASTFPESLKISGDAGKNNDFLKDNQTFFQQYASKINVGQEIAKDENGFLASAKKIYSDLEKHIDQSASKFGADNAAKQWKKDELAANILAYVSQYGANHGQITGNPAFKPGKTITNYEAELSKDNDRMVADLPNYRNYLLSKIGPDFQKYAASIPPTAHFATTEVFAKFLKGQNGYSASTKDYLLSFVASQDLRMGDYDTAQKISKVADENISDGTLKQKIKNLAQTIGGFKPGTQAPSFSITRQDGGSANFSDLKGKPTLVMLYASWNPYIAQGVMPVLKEVANFYKSKVNFAYLNFDDTKEQFVKTSNAMFKGMPGTSYYAGGLNSEAAKALGVYGFKLPGFYIIDKDGKFVGKYFMNLGEPDFVTQMDKISGLKAPMVQPQPQPGGGMTDPPVQAQPVPQPAPTK